jgi:recombination protein RecA
MKKKEKELSQDLSLEEIVKSLSKVIKSDVDPDIFGKPAWFLHSGAYSLDYILSGKVLDGGYPGGTETEIFGPPSTGKSLLLALAAANIQKLGGLAVILDAENRWDADFAKFHGVDPSRTIPIPIDTVEDFAVKTADILDDVIKRGGPKVLFILDSIAMLSTLKEVEDQGTKADQGRRAQRIRAAMRVLSGKIYEAQAIMIAANHTTEKTGVMFGDNRTTSGGSGYRYQSSCRLEMMPTKQIKIENKERPIGIVMHIKCAKSSVTIPFGECNLVMTWAKGVDPYSGLLDIALDIGVVSKVGTRYTTGEGSLFWANEFPKVCIEHPEILAHPAWVAPYFKVGDMPEEVNETDIQ